MTDMHFTLEAKGPNSKALRRRMSQKAIMSSVATNVRSTAGDVRSIMASWARVVVGVLAIVICCLMVLALNGPSNADSNAEPMEVTSYTVAPGDTLWSYAERITPRGGDVSETVDELKRINHLDTSSLRVGQRIVVPVR
ncbi:peptidoglycan-binding LysM domain [Bifidobacterium tissieri]|uniref:Peptidoglycan-binding LysM domain n=1 Tax=Bifidobacterium tissieri TaxID=1630162 RepID=A0A261FFQ7_9BIFI|nr:MULTISPECIES: LysM peptidoglycan-binding domain-containing protein [Bifidobacterium]OZG57803.1 peptidoglycan-binding LysM domain [Bifidobacterium tissieri]TPF97226.1 hypothetical protein EP30_03010 [Bifidobacterium sp. UTCIF-39]